MRFRRGDRRHVRRTIFAPEFLLGPVQEHAEVVAVDRERTADFVLVPLLDEKRYEHFVILPRQAVEDGPHAGAGLAAHQGLLDVLRVVRDILMLIAERFGPAVGAEGLEHEVVADRVDERAELAAVAKAIRRTDDAKDAEKDLLPDVLDGLQSAQAAAELDQKELAEVAKKMLFREAIACAQARDVVVVECVELHGILEATLLHAGREGLRKDHRKQSRLHGWLGKGGVGSSQPWRP